MERLPERPETDFQSSRESVNGGRSGNCARSVNGGSSRNKKEKSRKEIIKERISLYGPLLIVAMVLFFLFADEPVPLEMITVTNVQEMENEKATGVFIEGKLDENAGKFCKAKVSFDEESGTAEVRIRQYQVTTFLGTKDFIAYIEQDPKDVKEIWLVYDDEMGNVDKKMIQRE
ncbi:MAG: hypothetical protein ACI4SU_01615 [Anaerovoracaceae bacterium]